MTRNYHIRKQVHWKFQKIEIKKGINTGKNLNRKEGEIL